MKGGSSGPAWRNVADEARVGDCPWIALNDVAPSVTDAEPSLRPGDRSLSWGSTKVETMKSTRALTRQKDRARGLQSAHALFSQRQPE
jgi:hypothetical protein